MNSKPIDPSDSPTLTRDVGDGATHGRPLSPYASLASGQTFGPYLIHRLLGKGGMGEVYEAEQRETGRRVALKVMAEPDPSPEARDRFLREGRLAASVNHPNSVYIYGTEEIDGQWAISMELLAGGSLKDRLREKGPLPPQEAVDGILQIIDGLDAAASAGVLHRDIKPANCFVEVDGTVKIGDFGLSLSTLARERSRSHLTQSGTLLGTPAFASPEQLRGDEIDVRSDIYSVGATLYCLLTGRAPFEADNLMKLLTTIAEKPPESPRRENSKIPRGLASVVLQCLAKTPSERPKDYGALREKLRNWARTGEAPLAVLSGVAANGVDLALFLAISSPLLLVSFGTASSRSAIAGHPLEATALLVACGAVLVGAPVLLIGRSLGERLLGVWPGTKAGRGLVGWTLVGRALFLTVAVVALPVLQLHRETSFRRIFDYIILFGFLSWICGFRTIRRASPRSTRPPSPAENLDAQTWTQVLGPYRVAEGPRQGFVNAYDPLLRRPVWILHRETRPEAHLLRREVNRPTRLRWLNCGLREGFLWDAFEAPAGESLVQLKDGLAWNEVRHLLRNLLRELRTATGERTLPRDLGLGHIWIEPGGRVRVLDDLPPGLPPSPPILDPEDERILAKFAAAAARRLLGAHQKTLPRNARCFLFELENVWYGSLTSYLRMAAVLSRGTLDRSPVHLAVNAVGALLYLRGLLTEPRFLAFFMAAVAVSVPLALRSLRILSKEDRAKGRMPNNVLDITRSEELLTLDGHEPSQGRALQRNVVAATPLAVAAIGPWWAQIPTWQAAALFVIYVIGFISSARDGVGLAGWLTGTRWVAIHQPFGDWVRRGMNRYDVLRTATELSVFRDLDEADEAEWLQFQEQVRIRVS